ncbi:uncharacterized protein LOC119069156 [Bradysia coprophila]|uniref:uncharacterized protein LOC119069156 n=1 Tax=Bradysia coprophila TaxID=38358 RepID=UPI00187D8F28|nr:uncharacterized protein LOC119069156 [Bradysia coprophila]
MEELGMFGDSESESDSEKENHLQRSSDNFVEFMDIDVEPCIDAGSNEKQGRERFYSRVLQRQSLNGASNESDIDLESPFRRRGLTSCNSSNSNIGDKNYDESFVLPGVDRSSTSTKNRLQRRK